LPLSQNEPSLALETPKKKLTTFVPDNQKKNNDLSCLAFSRHALPPEQKLYFQEKDRKNYRFSIQTLLSEEIRLQMKNLVSNEKIYRFVSILCAMPCHLHHALAPCNRSISRPKPGVNPFKNQVYYVVRHGETWAIDVSRPRVVIANSFPLVGPLVLGIPTIGFQQKVFTQHVHTENIARGG